jgi:hypothetical protein
MLLLALPVLLAAAVAAAQQVPESRPDVDPILLLGRAKNKMSAALRGMPNYTCLQTIERSKRLPKRRKFELIDVLRLEVGLVEGKELFAWPGSGKFEDKELSDLVPPGGAIGNGAFAAHASSVFQGRAASITFESWEENPRRARYAYRVPQNLSGYAIRHPSKAKAIVGYHGHFWVRPEDDRVVRIDVEADDIPLFLEVLAMGSSIDYATVKIGETDYWLPTGSTMKLTNIDTAEYRNETLFSGCRQFAGESSLRFDDPPPEPEKAEPVTIPETVTLPKGAYFGIQVGQALKWGKTVTGEKIQGTLADAIKRKGVVLFPKGAIVEGRVLSFQAVNGGQILELQFSTISHGLRTAEFRAECYQPPRQLSVRSWNPQQNDRGIACTPGRFGVVSIGTLRGTTDIAKGFRISWTTVE